MDKLRRRGTAKIITHFTTHHIIQVTSSWAGKCAKNRKRIMRNPEQCLGRTEKCIKRYAQKGISYIIKMTCLREGETV